ncbi:MAG: hypothetical protein Q9225_001846 [Loekoesia sp. 1 TL-2023]
MAPAQWRAIICHIKDNGHEMSFGLRQKTTSKRKNTKPQACLLDQMSPTHLPDLVHHMLTKLVRTLTKPPGDYLTDPVHNDSYPAIDPLKADLSSKSVFISGASRGLGRAMALSFARAGASYIAIGARGDMTALVEEIKDKATAAKRKLPEVLPIKFDVTSQESIDNAAAVVSRGLKKLDILVNNAGVLSAKANVADTDPEEWWKAWTVNVRGTYLVTRAFLPLMLEGGDKQIVNVCSVGAHVVNPGLSAYQPSKLAQLRFTEFVCAEYGDQGVVAFCIHPGNIPTDIVGGLEGVPDSLKHGMCTFVGLLWKLGGKAD